MSGTTLIRCGYCDRDVAASIVHISTTDRSNTVIWSQCPNCYEGSVRDTTGVVHPSPLAGDDVGHLSDDVAMAWREARVAHGAGAFTASVVMCRKILMHLAVDVADSDPGQTFVAYVDDLCREGYVANGLKPVVDRVRLQGNVANHDLPASTAEDALTTIRITEHLLRTIYELPNV